MPRYLVTTRRSDRETAVPAADAVKNEPGVTPVETSNPNMVTVEASEEAANRLRLKLRDTHYVELETRHKLH